MADTGERTKAKNHLLLEVLACDFMKGHRN